MSKQHFGKSNRFGVPAPKPGALPTGPHPDRKFESDYTPPCAKKQPKYAKIPPVFRRDFFLHIVYAHDDNTGNGCCNAGIMLPAELFLQEQAAPQDGCHAVAGNDGSSQGGFATGKRVDVK